MRIPIRCGILFLCFVLFNPTWTIAQKHSHDGPVPRWADKPPTLYEPAGEIDAVGNVDGRHPAPRKVLQDTIWIADWDFDGAPCDDSGWARVDYPDRTDGQVYWSVGNSFSGVGGIAGNAAVLAQEDCCYPGYGNRWYQAIRIFYSGNGTLSFDYLTDSEEGSDFLVVELDSACASHTFVDFELDSAAHSSDFRERLFASPGGLELDGHVSEIPIHDFGTDETHCLYIAFTSDFATSSCDMLLKPTIDAALVVDHIELLGVDSPVSEDFEGGLDPNVSFVDLQDDVPFGNWGRTFSHITDNDFCAENTTCAWLWTDDTTPSIANDPSMAFGPGGFVVRNWLENTIVSPWVSLASTPEALGTVVEFRMFGGNNFANSRIFHGLGIREKFRGIDPFTLDSLDCIHNWLNHNTFVNQFYWHTRLYDITTSFLTGEDPEIQIRHRVADAQWVFGWSPPSSFVPGPGPFIDRTRIGRLVVEGAPVFRSQQQAQDAFPTEIDPAIPPGSGERYRPTTNRFGTTAFSAAGDLGGSLNVVAGDSIVMAVVDLRETGGTHVQWYGSIVEGPHQGKAPPPWTVGANGFFEVFPDTVNLTEGDLVLWCAVDLDDEYFRGGDVLRFFWLATDQLGGVSSSPAGLTSVPASVEAAEAATGGLHEVSFLPKINWDPSYLARVAADPHGKIEPNAEELANSSQANCILYSQRVNGSRRSGDLNRTSFMYTLDRLGYRGMYDVYEGSHLGGRATVQQAQGYSLIVYDVGNLAGTGSLMPDASHKVDQATWFRNWLAQASTSEAKAATLWVMGSNAMQERPFETLYTTEMAATFRSPDQGLAVNPDVQGMGTFTFTKPNQGTCAADFSNNEFSLNGGCPSIRDYDALDAAATGVATHRYADPFSGQQGDAAIVMNSDPANSWNTILQSFPWFDIRDAWNGSPFPQAEEDLLTSVLTCVLPADCVFQIDPTGVPGAEPAIDALPKRTVLYRNAPNPFNPMTTIRFDLAREGHVSLRIYDVAGRVVASLVDEVLKRDRHQVVWHGVDDAGQSVSSGIYFYRLETAEMTDTHKMIVLR